MLCLDSIFPTAESSWNEAGGEEAGEISIEAGAPEVQQPGAKGPGLANDKAAMPRRGQVQPCPFEILEMNPQVSLPAASTALVLPAHTFLCDGRYLHKGEGECSTEYLGGVVCVVVWAGPEHH